MQTKAGRLVALACVLALVFALAAPAGPGAPAILVAAAMVFDPVAAGPLHVSAAVSPSSPHVAASVPARAPPA